MIRILSFFIFFLSFGVSFAQKEKTGNEKTKNVSEYVIDTSFLKSVIKEQEQKQDKKFSFIMIINYILIGLASLNLIALGGVLALIFLQNKKQRKNKEELQKFLNDIKGRLATMDGQRFDGEKLEKYLNKKFEEIINFLKGQLPDVDTLKIKEIVNDAIKKIQETLQESQKYDQIISKISEVKNDVKNLEDRLKTTDSKVEREINQLKEQINGVNQSVSNVEKRIEEKVDKKVSEVKKEIVTKFDERVNKIEDNLQRIYEIIAREERKKLEEKLYNYTYPEYLHKRNLHEMKKNIKEIIYFKANLEKIPVYMPDVLFVGFNLKVLMDFEGIPGKTIYLIIPVAGVYKSPPNRMKEYFPEGTYKYISKYYDIAFDEDTENYEVEKFAFLEKDDNGEYKILLRGLIRR
ncbi:MAG: hypothetical protein ABIL76_01975 [candidate division WOR-3 bacterium]